jgi:hypothetical protein
MDELTTPAQYAVALAIAAVLWCIVGWPAFAASCARRRHRRTMRRIDRIRDEGRQ